MTRALTIIEDPDRDRALLERAAAFADEDTELVVLALVTPDEHERVVETLESIGRAEHTTYDEGDVSEALSADAADLVRDVLGEEVSYEIRTAVAERDEQADVVLDVAERTDCDHVFVPGRRRSPAGKAVFGDRTQRVILDFQGFVTVAMED